MRNITEIEYKIIRIFKGWDKNKFASNELAVRQLWAEYSEVELEYSHVEYVNMHMLALAQELELFSIPDNGKLYNFINELSPTQNWKYICDGYPELIDTFTYGPTILLSRLDSLFSNTEVKRLPGYSKFSLERKHGIAEPTTTKHAI